MEVGPLRWAASDGVFLFRVPDEKKILELEPLILLSCSLNAILIFLDQAQLTFNNNKLSIVRLNFHPPFDDMESNSNETGYVIHSSFKEGFGFQSIFYEKEISNELSEFENAFLESVVNNVLEKLEKEQKAISDIPYLQDHEIVNDVENMLLDIDTKYKALANSWLLASGSDCDGSKYDFTEVYFNGKIKAEDLFYDLTDRAIEILNILDFSENEKSILYRIAKGLIGLSGLLYEEDLNKQIRDDTLKFVHSEIILKTKTTDKLYRLDVRSYDVEGEQFCDVTIMGN